MRERHYAGGSAGSWHAPALDRSSPSPVPWTSDALDVYLRTGLVEQHAIAAGPMAPVTQNLGTVGGEDVTAIAVYIASWMQGVDRSAPTAVSAASSTQGAVIYATACAECHDKGRTTSSGGALELPLAIALSLPTPANLIHITLEGIPPRDGEAGRIMPGFAGSLSDDQVVSLLQYLRTDVAGKPPWTGLEREIKRIAGAAARD